MQTLGELLAPSETHCTPHQHLEGGGGREGGRKRGREGGREGGRERGEGGKREGGEEGGKGEGGREEEREGREGRREEERANNEMFDLLGFSYLPHLSMWKGTPPKEATASTRSRQLYLQFQTMLFNTCLVSYW